MKNLSRQVSADLITSYLTSTGTADVFSNQVDVSGFDGVLFRGIFGTTATSTGTGTFSVVGTNTSTAASTDYSTINGASVTIAASTTARAGRFLSVDVDKPKYRYLRAKLERTAGVRWQGTLADRYSARYLPTSPSTSTLASTSSNVLTVAAT